MNIGLSKILTLSLFFSCILLISCRNEIKDIRAITDVSHLPIQTSYNTEYTFSEKGRITHRLFATELNQYQGDEGYVEATGGFSMVFYDSLQKEEARLTATHGRFDEKAKRLKAWDKVELFNVSGEKLQTEELIYLQDSARIYSEKYVTITSANGSILHGEGIVSNESFTRYKIIKPKGELFIDEKKTELP